MKLYGLLNTLKCATHEKMTYNQCHEQMRIVWLKASADPKKKEEAKAQCARIREIYLQQYNPSKKR
jgi:hypothetical protein